MSQDRVFTGFFWVQGSTENRARGALSVGPRMAPTVEVTGELTSMWEVTEVRENPDGTKANISHLRDHETFTGPLMVHGVDDSGLPLTLVDAVTTGRNGATFGEVENPFHRLSGNLAVTGGHLTSRDHEFNGIRIRLQNFDDWASLLRSPDWATPVSLESDGRVVFEEIAGKVWLVVSEIAPMALRDLDRLFIQPTINLFTLAVYAPRGLLMHSVQDATTQHWWDVHTSSQMPEEGSQVASKQSLLHPVDLKLSNVAEWLSHVKTFGPLPTPIADLIGLPTISIESQVLQVTTAAEGLHRARFPEDKRIEDDTIADAIRITASVAVKELHPMASDYVAGLLGFVAEPGYNARLKRLAEEVSLAVPGVTGQRPNKWRTMVTDARNDFAHRLMLGNFFEDDHLDDYFTVATSLQWLLTGFLLLQAGIDPSLLRTRFIEFSEYQIFLKYAQLWKPTVYGNPNQGKSE
jgi:hypothetical protein